MDKWLWAVRLYKTRSLAAQACNLGRVQISGQQVKPSRVVRAGDVITAVTGDIARTVKVTGFVEQRVGAKLVSQYLEDLTPPSEYEKPREKAFQPLSLKPLSRHPPKRRRRSFSIPPEYWEQE
jgi:ribosome-associated heat shock protein Hsp15